MTFNLVNLDCKKITETSILKIEYLLESNCDDNCEIKIVASDVFFNLKRELINRVEKNIGYFTVFDYTNDVPGISEGFNIEVIDNKSGVILFKKNYRLPEKNIWIFGDSHALHIKNKEINNIIENTGYNLNCVGSHSLSLNRFINGDYIGYLEKYNIKKEDYIFLYFGEIDFRYTIHKHCENKNKNIYIECYNLMLDYLTAVKKIKEKYSNDIVILSPNPPMRDFYLKDLVLGTESDRKLCWDIFNIFWKKIGENYLDWTDNYKLSDGFINCEILKENDHHITDYFSFIKTITRYINNEI
jgi:hypothetical protein